MDKLDLKKQYKELYKPTARKVALVDVPEFNFIMVDGTIPANTEVGDAPDYINGLEALFSLAYTIKFMSKLHKDNPIDYTVMPSEGQWWTDKKFESFKITHDDPWYFRAMIMQPEHITKAMFEEAKEQIREKKNPVMLDQVRFEPFHEGLCVQIMHLGPYSEEPATLEKMEAFMEENGYVSNGLHHEIYLSDPRRAKPENLKTVLRHPVKKK
ncbi:MAG: hypothetical protein DWQ07_13015 [Chloroflexi bacterium]|nr:MAG: hypothetical protein DWQ07_13015 [Chloroflexota bacterium]MBL1196961.1 hypothetical protein [Chloroflexota bacterium]NOH14257.1 hypothetical protein [Chloroflexota bacterium]